MIASVPVPNQANKPQIKNPKTWGVELRIFERIRYNIAFL